MRTSLEDGLLFFAYGAMGSYWMVYLNGGQMVVVMAVESLVTTVMTDEPEGAICDGRWHEVK